MRVMELLQGCEKCDRKRLDDANERWLSDHGCFLKAPSEAPWALPVRDRWCRPYRSLMLRSVNALFQEVK